MLDREVACEKSSVQIDDLTNKNEVGLRESIGFAVIVVADEIRWLCTKNNPGQEIGFNEKHKTMYKLIGTATVAATAVSTGLVTGGIINRYL